MLGARASSPAPRAQHAKISEEIGAGYCSRCALSADEDVRASSKGDFITFKASVMDMIPVANKRRFAPLRSFEKVFLFRAYKRFISGGVFLIGLTVVLLANCQKPKIQPVAIDPNDMCSFCRMSISERRYAAEFLDTDGQAFKFDDLGCMANFLKQKRNTAEVRATFVMDFEHPQWIKAESAFYVRSTEFQSPMSGGIVAFANKSSADVAVTKYHGTLLRFDEVVR